MKRRISDWYCDDFGGNCCGTLISLLISTWITEVKSLYLHISVFLNGYSKSYFFGIGASFWASLRSFFLYTALYTFMLMITPNITFSSCCSRIVQGLDEQSSAQITGYQQELQALSCISWSNSLGQPGQYSMLQRLLFRACQICLDADDLFDHQSKATDRDFYGWSDTEQRWKNKLIRWRWQNSEWIVKSTDKVREKRSLMLSAKVLWSKDQTIRFVIPCHANNVAWSVGTCGRERTAKAEQSTRD